MAANKPRLNPDIYNPSPKIFYGVVAVTVLWAVSKLHCSGTVPATHLALKWKVKKREKEKRSELLMSAEKQAHGDTAETPISTKQQTRNTWTYLILT